MLSHGAIEVNRGDNSCHLLLLYCIPYNVLIVLWIL